MYVNVICHHFFETLQSNVPLLVTMNEGRRYKHYLYWLAKVDSLSLWFQSLLLRFPEYRMKLIILGDFMLSSTCLV